MAKKEMLFKKTKLKRDFSKLNKLLYGFPKTGKTTLAATQIDDEGKEPLFIATEDGHHALEVYAQKVTSWAGFLKLVEILKKNATVLQEQHSCFIVDLVSDLDAMCAEYVAEKNNVKHIADMDFGKGFALQRQEFQAGIKELFAILPVTFIAHGSEKELNWNGEKIKVQAPSLSKGCLEFVNGKVDCIMWLIPATSKKLHPEVTMKNTTMSIAGSRYKQLARNFPLYVNDPARTYKEIQKVFADETEAPVEPKDDSQNTKAAAQPRQAASL